MQTDRKEYVEKTEPDTAEQSPSEVKPGEILNKNNGDVVIGVPLAVLNADSKGLG